MKKIKMSTFFRYSEGFIVMLLSYFTLKNIGKYDSMI